MAIIILLACSISWKLGIDLLSVLTGSVIDNGKGGGGWNYYFKSKINTVRFDIQDHMSFQEWLAYINHNPQVESWHAFSVFSEKN